ncbi:MAG TPA: hypothetical protein VFW53_03665 [Gallionella sp.]|nr:hypothetical protein [Gallionella sp.]
MATDQPVQLASDAAITFQSVVPELPGAVYRFTVIREGQPIHQWTGNGHAVELTGSRDNTVSVLIEAQLATVPPSFMPLETKIHTVGAIPPHLPEHFVMPVNQDAEVCLKVLQSRLSQ